MDTVKFTPLFFSSSDEENASDVENVFETPISSKKPAKPTYKLFKSKNDNLSIESSCDVWKFSCTPNVKKKPAGSVSCTPKYSVSYAPVGKKKPASSKSATLKVPKTRAKVAKSESKVLREPKQTKTSSKILKDEIFNDFEEMHLSPLRINGPIEKNRSSVQKKKEPEQAPDLYHDDFGIMGDAVVGESTPSNLEELCQDFSSIDISKDSRGDASIKIPEKDLENFIKDLSEILKLIQHSMPYLLFKDICRLLAILNMAKGTRELNDPDHLKEIGFYLSQTVSLTFGQTYLNRALKDQQKPKEQMWSYLKVVDSCLVSQMDRYLSAIPKDWTVVQINAVPDKDWLGGAYQQPTFSKLIITQYRSMSPPLVVCVDSTSTERFISGLMSEFEDILLQSTVIIKKYSSAKKWWLTRSSLDSRLKTLLSNMENSWLGCWKGLLLGTAINKERKQQLSLSVEKISKSFMPLDKRLLEVLLDSASLLNREQLTACICHLWDCYPHQETYSTLYKAIVAESQKSTIKRNPVVLLLDKDIQALPWESIPILNGSPVTRMPSLPILAAQLSIYGQDSVFHKGVDCDRTYYVLNPSGDLLNSQETFQEKFKSQTNWKGIVGKKPQSAECLEAVKDNDLFLYIGHGNGRQYFDSSAMLECNAAALLIGCSSGRLHQSGRRLEPEGFVLKCLMNGSPCVIGNLWDVTDRDIDRFTDKFLELFVPNYSKSSKSVSDISNSVSQARVFCKMNFLNGAAPVIYGFPIFSQR